MANLLQISFFIAASCTIAGCSSNSIKKETIQPNVIKREYYETKIGPLPSGQPLYIEPWVFDFPRNTNTSPVVKNTTSCKKIKIENQDENFWKRCGEFPVDTNSNLYLGMTLAEYKKYEIGMRQIKNSLIFKNDQIKNENLRRQNIK
jgi:hypothetical protein